MLIVKIEAESNGAHANQSINGNIAVPIGWLAIPSELESTAMPFLPWVKLTITNDVITAIEEDTEAKEAWSEPTADPGKEERISALEEAVLGLLGA